MDYQGQDLTDAEYLTSIAERAARGAQAEPAEIEAARLRILEIAGRQFALSPAAQIEFSKELRETMAYYDQRRRG